MTQGTFTASKVTFLPNFSSIEPQSIAPKGVNIEAMEAATKNFITLTFKNLNS